MNFKKIFQKGSFNKFQKQLNSNQELPEKGQPDKNCLHKEENIFQDTKKDLHSINQKYGNENNINKKCLKRKISQPEFNLVKNSSISTLQKNGKMNEIKNLNIKSFKENSKEKYQIGRKYMKKQGELISNSEKEKSNLNNIFQSFDFNQKPEQIPTKMEFEVNSIKKMEEKSNFNSYLTNHDIKNEIEEKYQFQNIELNLADSYDKLMRDSNLLRNELNYKNNLIQNLNEKIFELNSKISELEKIPEEISRELGQNYSHEIEIVKNENKFLLDENNTLKNLILKLSDQISKNDASTQKSSCNKNDKIKNSRFYKVLSEKQLKICSTLAEQVICLRSDLEKVNKEKLLDRNKKIDSCLTDQQFSKTFSSPKVQKSDNKLITSECKETNSTLLIKNDFEVEKRQFSETQLTKDKVCDDNNNINFNSNGESTIRYIRSPFQLFTEQFRDRKLFKTLMF